MTGLVDDETEAARLIFGGGHQKALFLDMKIAPATPRGNHLDHAGVMLRTKGRNHDPVIGMISLKSLLILEVGFAGFKLATVDVFPLARPPVTQGPVGAFLLVTREQVWKGQGDDRPFAIFLYDDWSSHRRSILVVSIQVNPGLSSAMRSRDNLIFGRRISSGSTLPRSMGWVQEGVTILIRGCLGQRRLPVRQPGSAETDRVSVDYYVSRILGVLQARAIYHDAGYNIFPKRDKKLSGQSNNDLFALSCAARCSTLSKPIRECRIWLVP